MKKTILTLFKILIFIHSSFAKSLDTIPTFPTMKLGNEWIELGISGSYGIYKTDFYNGPGLLTKEEIKNQSINFIGSYNWGLRRGRMAIGMMGAFGSGTFKKSINDFDDFNFTGVGVFGVIESKLIGLKYGFYYSDNDNKSFIYKGDLFELFNLRIGKSRSYYFDIGLRDNFGFSLFPEPTLSIGFFNYGFNDPSGMRKIRIAISNIRYDNAVSIGFRHPISQSPLIFDGVFHIRKQLMTTLGIRYRFDMSWK